MRLNVTSLAISIVTHAPDLTLLARVLEHLGRALRHASQQGGLTEARLVLVDNGPGPGWREPLQRALDAATLPAAVELRSGHGNVGYGAGHNLAFQACDDEIHLILNPDVLLEEDALSAGLAFLATHPEAGLVTPAAWGETANGNICASASRPYWIWRCAALRLAGCGAASKPGWMVTNGATRPATRCAGIHPSSAVVSCSVGGRRWTGWRDSDRSIFCISRILI